MALRFSDIKQDKELCFTSGEIGRKTYPEVFVNDLKISRKHIKITIKNDKAYIQDLGSSNGTSINGDALEPHKVYQIKIGNVLEIGSYMLRLMDFKKSNLDATSSTRDYEVECIETEKISFSKKDRTALREDLIQKIDEIDREFGR